MKLFFYPFLFATFCSFAFESCGEKHSETIQSHDNSRFTLNRHLPLNDLSNIGIWYLYLSNYEKTEKVLLSKDNFKEIDCSSIEFKLYDVTFLSKDTLIFSYETLFDRAKIMPSPEIDTQVIFFGNKVIGLGAGRAFSFFSENPDFCGILQSKFKLLSLDGELQNQLKLLSTNALALEEIRGSSECLSNATR